MKAYEYLAAQPLMVTAEALQAAIDLVTRVSAARGDPIPEMVAAKKGRAVDSEGVVEVRDNVAIIQIYGPVYRHANMLQTYCGGETVDGLALDLASAIANPSVNAILFDIESPGGEAAGIGEFAAMVRAASAVKPIECYVGSQAASAGYWIASACPKITIAPTAQVGCVGVVMSYPIRSDREKASAWEVVSDDAPDKRPDVTTDAGRQVVKARINALATVFRETVAEYRNVTPEVVAETFGRGSVVIGKAAVAAGMADRIGSFESTLSDLAARGRQAIYGPYASHLESPPTMNFLAKLSAFLFGAQAAAAGITHEDAMKVVDSIRASEAGATNGSKADHGSRADAPTIDVAETPEFKAIKARLDAAEKKEADRLAAEATSKSQSIAAKALALATAEVTALRAEAKDIPGLERQFLRALNDPDSTALTDLSVLLAAKPKLRDASQETIPNATLTTIPSVADAGPTPVLDPAAEKAKEEALLSLTQLGRDVLERRAQESAAR